jgi:hypothetical protein
VTKRALAETLESLERKLAQLSNVADAPLPSADDDRGRMMAYAYRLGELQTLAKLAIHALERLKVDLAPARRVAS